MTDAVADLRGRVGHAGRHQPGEIGLDLIVDIVGMGVVEPMPGILDALDNVVACDLVCMPQLIIGMGEGRGKRIDRSLEPFAFEHLDECKIHVDVVVNPRALLHQVAHISLVPGERLVILDIGPVIQELCLAAVGYAQRLSGPSALDLVQQALL